MSLRDIFLLGIFAILVPKILVRPYIGALAWVLFGVMSPHRLTWGWAYDFQFSFIIAIATLAGLALGRDHRELKGGAPLVVLVLFTLWVTFTTFVLPFNPDPAFAYWWDRVIKAFVMTGVIMVLLHTRRQIELLIWMLVIALGFYGSKGGVFTIWTGGQHMVYGPPGSVMEGNNSLGVGLVIVIPLMMYLYQQYQSKWVKLGLAVAMILCAVSVLGSYSRGALLAVFAMGSLLWIRSTHKLPIFIGALLFTLVAIPAMPDRWITRMHTIETYEEDTSAQQRIASWTTAYNIAKDKFPMGGGLEWNSEQTSALYSPQPEWEHVAHSIYFQTLGSQGFTGLALFLLFWWLVWRQCAWIMRKTRDHPELRWAYSLASMTQVSLVGYAVGGAFLDLAFWDLPYYLYAAVGVTQYVVSEQLSLLTDGSRATESASRAAVSSAKSFLTG